MPGDISSLAAAKALIEQLLARFDPGANVGAYSASKAAMVSLIRTVAQENKDAGLTRM